MPTYRIQKIVVFILSISAAAFVLACGNDDNNSAVDSGPTDADTDTGGEYLWHTFYGSNLIDDGYSIFVDEDGNVYVTGESDGSWDGPNGENPLNAHYEEQQRDAFVLKLDKDGIYQWHTFFGGADWDIGFSLVIDETGNIFVAGQSGESWTGPNGENPFNEVAGTNANEIFVLKLSSSGDYQWHTFHGTSNFDKGSIALDGDGNILVTGHTRQSWDGPDGQSPLNALSVWNDIFVLKLSANGAYQWHTFYGGSEEDISSSVAVDDAGNLYLTGRSFSLWNGPDGQDPLYKNTRVDYSSYKRYPPIISDIFVLKLDSDGEYQWHIFFITDGDDAGGGLALDETGNIYVTGFSAAWNGPDGQNPLNAHSGVENVFVVKLSSDGTYQWHTFSGSGSSGESITLDEDKNLLVTGYSKNSWNGPEGQSPLNEYSGGYDIFVLVLNSDGAYRWHSLYGSPDGDIGYSIVADGAQNLFVTGRSSSSWLGPDDQDPLNPHTGGTDDLGIIPLADFFVLKLAD
jgi:hypothetical protein